MYGSHIEYENIIRRVRERTCADILLQTDHITTDASLTEETNPANLTPKQWDSWMNHTFLLATAAKYGACRADIHVFWKDLPRHQSFQSGRSAPGRGASQCPRRMAAGRTAQGLPGATPADSGYDPLNETWVRTVTPRLSAGQKSLRLEFSGTQADLVFKSNAKGSISVLVDGKRTSAVPELYGFTRVSAFPMGDWPVLLRVG